MFATLYYYSTDLCPLQQNDYADEIDTAKLQYGVAII